MSAVRRPILAAETPEDLYILERLGHFPMFGSYKLDGIRGTDRGFIASRTGKQIPSAYARKFVNPRSLGLDGELMAKIVPPGLTVYQAAYSAVMTHGSMEPLNWVVFDRDVPGPYGQRYEDLIDLVDDVFGSEHPDIIILEQRLLNTVVDVLEMEQEALDAGHEGLIVRRPDAPYKQGRSTLIQGYLVKVARRLISEAWVTGFEELMHNDNPEKLNEVGYTKRSSDQAGLRPSGMLGAFLVREHKTGVEFSIGIGEGLDFAMRKDVWEHQPEFLGRLMKYDFKPYGTVDKPRQPRWLGWRSVEDM